MIRRQPRHPSTTTSVFWLAVTCLMLWSLGLQTPNVSAYQGDEPIPSLTLESGATLPPEETQPESTGTATSAPTFTAASPAPVLAGDYAPDQILVGFKRTATNESILECLSSSNTMALSSIEELNVWVMRIPFGEVAESIAALSVCPAVRYAEPNYMASIADTIPSDSSWNLQYGLINIHAPQGWDLSTGSSAVTIAIIDTGVDLSHADLAAKIVGGYDFANNDASAQDDNGHGTHAAGIAAASSNNGTGVAGVSWGARIMPIKALNASGNGTYANVAAGITWAADRGAQVINLSLGGASTSIVLEDAVNYAYGKGVVLVAAAGNTGANSVLYPARYPNVIAVTATDGSNARAGFSNYGPEVGLSAPGVSIYSTFIGGYGYKSGTSMSAPFVSGLAAIVSGIPGYASPALVESVLETTALDLGAAGRDDYYGYGLIQMDQALQVIPLTYTLFFPIIDSKDNFIPSPSPTR